MDIDCVNSAVVALVTSPGTRRMSYFTRWGTWLADLVADGTNGRGIERIHDLGTDHRR